MPDMIKKSLAGLLLFFSAGVFAQGGTPSPYSFFGIGEIVAGGTADARAMGGIGVVSDSIHINLLNPAGYASIKRTSLGVGALHTRSVLTTNTAKDNGNSTNLNYLAIAIPLQKWGFGFGVMPYSSVGYKIMSRERNEADTGDDIARFTGSGGVNRVYLGGAYAINERLNVGLQYDYNFGQTEAISTRIPYGVQYGGRENAESDISGSTLTAGLNYTRKVGKKYDLYASAVYAFKTDLNVRNTRTLSTIAVAANGDETVIDTQNEGETRHDISLPARLTFGVGIGEARKWLVATEASLASGASGGRFDMEGVGYGKGARYSVGGYFIPRYDAYRGYFKRVTYRGGFRYEDTGISVNGQKIEDMAVTFGFGFPIRGSFTNLNLGFELGKRGTKAAGLIHENYTKITLAFSFSDLWFVKPKYD